MSSSAPLRRKTRTPATGRNRKGSSTMGGRIILVWLALLSCCPGGHGGRAEDAGGKPGSLPAPWMHRDIGDVSVSGDARVADGTFTIVGTLDIWGKADGFHYAYVPLVG